MPRDPLNWYARTKVLAEGLVEDMADGAFPAHTFMKSNLYGEHRTGGQRVSKVTVINFFINRALSGDTVTVYEPGTQSRNFVHVDDVARAYLHSTERLLEALAAGESGVTTYELASDEDPAVMDVAQTVEAVAADVAGIDADVELVENPRDGEAMVEEFGVDTSSAESELGWVPERTVEETVRSLIAEKAE